MSTRYRHIVTGVFAKYLRTDARGRIILKCEQGMVWLDMEQFKAEWKEID